MKTVARLLVGYRDDIQLSQQWWHRLIKVISLLVFLVIAGLIVIVKAGETRETTVADIRIINNLLEFTKEADVSIENTIPVFLALEGHLGGIEDSGNVVYVSSYGLDQGFCTNDVTAHIHALTLTINQADSTKQYTAARMAGFVQQERNRLKAGEDHRYCWIRTGTVPPTDKIVKYHYTAMANIRYWLRISAISSVVLVLIAFLSLNLYYRGVVYIFCGPRTSV